MGHCCDTHEILTYINNHSFLFYCNISNGFKYENIWRNNVDAPAESREWMWAMSRHRKDTMGDNKDFATCPQEQLAKQKEARRKKYTWQQDKRYRETLSEECQAEIKAPKNQQPSSIPLQKMSKQANKDDTSIKDHALNLISEPPKSIASDMKILLHHTTSLQHLRASLSKRRASLSNCTTSWLNPTRQLPNQTNFRRSLTQRNPRWSWKLWRQNNKMGNASCRKGSIWLSW